MKYGKIYIFVAQLCQLTSLEPYTTSGWTAAVCDVLFPKAGSSGIPYSFSEAGFEVPGIPIY